MKKFFITAIVLIVNILAMPAMGTFAEGKELEDIPTRGYPLSSKAYCLYDESGGEYTLTYINSNGTKQLYKSQNDFKSDETISEDGKTVFFSIDKAIYRYSYESDKREKIYTVPEKLEDIELLRLYSSPNGEYCTIYMYMEYDETKLILWHDGKTVTQTEETKFAYGSENCFYGADNLGKVFYTINDDIYILDFDGKRLAEKAPKFFSDGELVEEEYGYRAWLFKESRTYFTRSECTAYFGEIGGKRHKLSFSQDPIFSLETINGESFIAYNDGYLARYDMKSGRKKNILKMDTKKYMEKRSDFIVFSEDLNEIVYINYSKKKLVRLSDWNAEKNRYTKRQEIKLNGTGREYINPCMNMNIIVVGSADDKNNYYTADFDNGSFVPTEYFYETDRFGHNIIKNGGKIEILNFDGSTTMIFDDAGITCDIWFSNGFCCFYSGGPDVSCNYEGKYDLTYYYIDKNGNAVKWYDETAVYMFEREEDCWVY